MKPTVCLKKRQSIYFDSYSATYFNEKLYRINRSNSKFSDAFKVRLAQRQNIVDWSFINDTNYSAGESVNSNDWIRAEKNFSDKDGLYIVIENTTISGIGPHGGILIGIWGVGTILTLGMLPFPIGDTFDVNIKMYNSTGSLIYEKKINKYYTRWHSSLFIFSSEARSAFDKKYFEKSILENDVEIIEDELFCKD